MARIRPGAFPIMPNRCLVCCISAGIICFLIKMYLQKYLLVQVELTIIQMQFQMYIKIILMKEFLQEKEFMI